MHHCSNDSIRKNRRQLATPADADEASAPARGAMEGVRRIPVWKMTGCQSIGDGRWSAASCSRRAPSTAVATGACERPTELCCDFRGRLAGRPKGSVTTCGSPARSREPTPARHASLRAIWPY